MNAEGMFRKTALVLFLGLGLTACGGGGGGSDDCVSNIPGFCQRLGVTTTTAQTGGGQSNTTPSGGTTGGTTATSNPIVLRPNALTIGDCTTNIPFIFSGGTAPFTILTSDNFNIPVSSAQPLGSKHFFLANIGPLTRLISTAGGIELWEDKYPPATLTVLDSQQQTATVTLSFPVTHRECPPNPLLQTTPASANAHVTEILAFQVAGGDGTWSAASSDDSIATVTGQSASAVNVQAKAVGTALITVSSSDGQKANIVFTVLPLQQ